MAEVSEEMGGSLDEIDLLEIETGRRAISESDLKTLSGLYGVRTSSMVPSRSQLVIDLDEGLITADGFAGGAARSRHRAGREGGAEQVPGPRVLDAGPGAPARRSPSDSATSTCWPRRSTATGGPSRTSCCR